MRQPTRLLLPSSTHRKAALAGVVSTAVSGIVVAFGAPHVATFIICAIALAALAAVMGQSIDAVGSHWGPGPTSLLHSSLGNLPELLVSIFALSAGLVTVVQAALVGSILSNVLLVLGLAFVSGGLKHGPQSFEPEAPRMLATLLSLAVAALLVPTLATHLDPAAKGHASGLSDACAVLLVLVYALSIPFWMKGGSPDDATRERGGLTNEQGGLTHEQKDGAQGNPRRPKSTMPLATALVMLVVGSAATAAVSDWFVTALTPATEVLGLSSTFTGLVVVAIASNAVENVVGVRFALAAKPDYAISSILNSPLQIALLLTPALVLISAFGPHHLTLVFPPMLVAALVVAIAVVVVVVYDGEYSWLEGAALVALYAIIAASLWWG